MAGRELGFLSGIVGEVAQITGDQEYKISVNLESPSEHIVFRDELRSWPYCHFTIGSRLARCLRRRSFDRIKDHRDARMITLVLVNCLL